MPTLALKSVKSYGILPAAYMYRNNKAKPMSLIQLITNSAMKHWKYFESVSVKWQGCHEYQQEEAAMQRTAVPQRTALKLGAAGQGSQNPHFQLSEGRTEANSKLEQKALTHSMAWKRALLLLDMWQGGKTDSMGSSGRSPGRLKFPCHSMKKKPKPLPHTFNM